MQPKSRKLSQNPTQSQPIDSDYEKEMVNMCVRYFLFKAGSGHAIRKSDVQKMVLKNVGKNYNNIFTKCKQVLNEVYGLDVYECDKNKSAIWYLVSNLLPYRSSAILDTRSLNTTNNIEGQPIPEDTYKILIMIVLAHVFMSGRNISQTSLFSFLRNLNIDTEEYHELFGNVKTFVCTTMVKQRYLNQETDGTTQLISYSWGPKAEHEISKIKLLEFVSKIYNRTPQTWHEHYLNAEAQFQPLENNVEAMTVDD